MRDIVICSSERTGSTLLSELLQGIGVCYFGTELFDDFVMKETVLKNLPDWSMETAKRHPLDYVEAVREKWFDPSRQFCVKIHWPAYAQWRQYGLDLTKFFREPRFIFCTRANVALQAISSVRAIQTGSWVWRQAEQRQPTYDFNKIRDRISSLTNESVQWETFFRDKGISPFRCTYEGLDHDFRFVLRHALRWIGKEVSEDQLAALNPRMKRQRDDLNFVWLHRYWAELGAMT